MSNSPPLLPSIAALHGRRKDREQERRAPENRQKEKRTKRKTKTMQSSSSRGVAVGDPGYSGVSNRVRGTPQPLSEDILCTIFSHLDDQFDLVRCSAVCKSWNNIIYTTHLMRDLYYKRNPHASGSSTDLPSRTSMKRYFEELAMDEHISSFSSGPVEVDQWFGHPMRATLCRMRSGSILTGVGDRVLRLWSAESCKYMREYNVPNMRMLVDFDFDENKIVGLTSSQLCIWRRNKQNCIFQSAEGAFKHGLSMSYADPEVVVGCEDGRASVFDMYSRNCSSILRLHDAPVMCLTIIDDQLIVGGSTFGTVAITDLTSGERVGLLKTAFSPTAIRCLSFNATSHLVFAGSSSGYAHCWDLRTLKPLWETRVSPNVIYSAHHLSSDTTTIVVGGIDGVLRMIRQSTGELLRSFVADPGYPAQSRSRQQVIEKKGVQQLAPNAPLDAIPRYMRPSITCLSVGLRKIVTTHGENYIRVWRFRC